MKILFSILLCVLALEVRAQYPTVTSSLSYSRTISSHGFSVGEWLTVDDNGDIVTGTDPSTQPFIGVVSKVVSANVFEYAPPGGPITLSGLTAGEIYYAQTDGSIEPESTATETNKPVLKAISTTQAILLSGSFGTTSGLSPPSEQVQNIFTSDVSSSGLTITISRGNGDGAIILASTGIINTFPSNNVPYTGDLNFPDGDELASSGVYVIKVILDDNEDTNSAVITGLTAGTTYYITALEFATQGPLISYNTIPEFNSTAVNTLADATTPTTQYTIISKKSKETSIEVIGTRGDGDNIVVVANDSIPVSVDIADGVDPSAGPFGSGTNLTERNYVVYEGSSATFSITGLSRDRKIYFKVYEREDTGFKYNTLSSVDSAYTAFIYEGGTGAFAEGTGDPPGQVYLEASAKIYYDLSDLTFADEANITNGDAGLVDQGPNAFTATIQGTPVTNEITFNSASRKSARSTSTNALNTGTDGATILVDAAGFEVIIALQITDGILASGNHVFSGVVFNSWGYTLQSLANGTLQMSYTSPAGSSTVTTTTVQLADGVNDGLVLRFKYDFTADVFSIYKNGSAITVGAVSGVAISSHTNTSWNPTRNIYFGNRYTGTGGGAPPTNPGENSITRFAITPIMTAQEAIDVTDWFSFTATAGAAFDEWDVVETDAYDQETITDSLHLSGSAGGFDNYVTHIDILPDSLQEWEITASFRISGALTTNPSGLGLLIRNDEAEPNYSVMGHINLDTDATSFGKAQIFSGDGDVDFDDFIFRGASSGEFVPAEDSVYRLSLKSELQNNDVLYSLQIFDYYDSAVLNTAFVAPNRPLSDYYGTTTKVGFWFQGPDFMIGEFSVVRTGTDVDDTAPPPTPITYDFRQDNINGLDTNPCTDPLPCLTIPVTMAAAEASGGSNKTVGLGPGNPILTTNVNIPLNVSLVEGAGIGVTKISGASNLNHGFQFLPGSWSLFRLASNSLTTHNVTLRGFTVVGGNATSRNISCGIYSERRSGITIENVRAEYFNTSGMWLGSADDITVRGCEFYQAGGTSNQGANGYITYPEPGTAYEPPPGYSLAALVPFGPTDNFLVEDCYIDGERWGTGYGIKTAHYPATYGVGDMDNFRVTNSEITVHPKSGGSTGTNFLIECHQAFANGDGDMGDVEIDSNTFRNGAISLVARATQSPGDHRIHHNTFTCNDNRGGWIIENDIDNLEFDYNYVTSPYSGAVFASFDKAGKTNSNHHYHHNVFETGNSPFTQAFLWKGTSNASSTSYSNYLIEENTFNFQSTAGGQFWFILATSTGGTLNLTVQNNAFYGDPPGSNNMFSLSSGNTFSSSTFRNNFATHLLTTQTASGLTSSNNQTGLNGSTWFNFTGSKYPVLINSYYAFGPGSPLYNAGYLSRDAGAYQHE